MYQQVEKMIMNIHWLRPLSKQDKLFCFLNKDNISNKNYTIKNPKIAEDDRDISRWNAPYKTQRGT